LIHIFQKEMSDDAPDAFGPMIMHVLGMCIAMDTQKHPNQQLQGAVEKEMHPYF
jgi:hypothetical protein